MCVKRLYIFPTCALELRTQLATDTLLGKIGLNIGAPWHESPVQTAQYLCKKQNSCVAHEVINGYTATVVHSALDRTVMTYSVVGVVKPKPPVRVINLTKSRFCRLLTHCRGSSAQHS